MGCYHLISALGVEKDTLVGYGMLGNLCKVLSAFNFCRFSSHLLIYSYEDRHRQVSYISKAFSLFLIYKCCDCKFVFSMCYLKQAIILSVLLFASVLLAERFAL